MAQTVLITGGTGMIGKRLTQLLLEKGYQVAYLSRRQETIPNVTVYRWDVDKQFIDERALIHADYIIHLAGAGVMDKKWTNEYKKEIISSRADSARLIVDSLKKHPNKVKAIISASAIGWYNATNTIHTEEEEAADNFLGQTTRLWEESMKPVLQMDKRLVKLRIEIGRAHV